MHICDTSNIMNIDYITYKILLLNQVYIIEIWPMYI